MRLQGRNVARQRETILVIDDDPEILGLLRVCLENAGYVVFTAADGEDGLRVYQKLQARIALLLTDVNMPKMSGLALADRVRQFDSRLPVVFMSGDVVDPNDGGAWIAKPFNPRRLASMIDQVLVASEKGKTWPA